MKKLFYCILMALIVIGCKKEKEEILLPKSNFSYSPIDNLKVDDTVSFSNSSLNASYYYWDFGDGSSSAEMDPKYLFTIAGSYKFKLISFNENYKNSDTLIQTINIRDYTTAELLCRKKWSLESFLTDGIYEYLPLEDLQYIYYTFNPDGSLIEEVGNVDKSTEISNYTWTLNNDIALKRIYVVFKKSDNSEVTWRIWKVNRNSLQLLDDTGFYMLNFSSQ